MLLETQIEKLQGNKTIIIKEKGLVIVKGSVLIKENIPINALNINAYSILCQSFSFPKDLGAALDFAARGNISKLTIVTGNNLAKCLFAVMFPKKIYQEKILPHIKKPPR